MTAQTAPFGLLCHADLRRLVGAAAPSLWRLDDADVNAYGAGDIVVDSLRSIGGTPVATLYGGRQVAADPMRVESLLQGTMHAFGVVVAVSPAMPLDPVNPVIPTGGGSGRSIWVLPAAAHVFDVAGDNVAPTRADLPASGSPPYTLSEQMLSEGIFTATLGYGAPAGGRSGSMLQGATFSTAGRGELVVIGLVPGVALGPGALFRVRLKAPSPLPRRTSQSVVSSDGM